MLPNEIPLHLRRGIMLPTPANIERVRAESEAKRAAEAEVQRKQPVNLARKWNIPTELAQFLQRMEAHIIELQNEVAYLRTRDKNSLTPPHMHNLEKR